MHVTKSLLVCLVSSFRGECYWLEEKLWEFVQIAIRTTHPRVEEVGRMQRRSPLFEIKCAECAWCLLLGAGRGSMNVLGNAASVETHLGRIAGLHVKS